MGPGWPELAFAAVAISVTGEAKPNTLRVPFNNTGGYGPDGPWHYISLPVGSSSQVVDFYPVLGHTRSFLQSSEACGKDDTVSICLDPLPGLYDTGSALALTASSSQHGWIPIDEWEGCLSGGAVNYTGGGKLRVDTINDGGEATRTPFYLTTNVTAHFATGSYVPLSLLSLEAKSETPPIDDSGDVVNYARTYLADYVRRNPGASHSFALHLGSPKLQQNASLYFGGYDQNRLIEEPAVFDIDSDIVIKAIALSAGPESSTFTRLGPSRKLPTSDNLLTTPLKVRLDPSTPYLTLPRSVCDRIAQHLPIVYNASVGIYTWQTSGRDFRNTGISSSFLNFTFADDANTSIRVPLALLNLMLTKPLVDEPQAYFPCAPLTYREDSVFVLGRAFLQGAFLAANHDEKKLYVGQAPGPAQQDERVISIAAGDSFHPSADAISWEDSWASVFRPLSQNLIMRSSTDDSTDNEGDDTDASTSTSNPDKPGLSHGAVAGIVIGAVAGLVMLIAIGTLACLWLRRRRLGSMPTISINPSQLDVSLVDIKPARRGRPKSSSNIYADGMSGYHEVDMSEKLIKRSDRYSRSYSRSHSRHHTHQPSASISELSSTTASRLLDKPSLTSITSVNMVELDDTSPAPSRSASRSASRSVSRRRARSPSPPPVPPKPARAEKKSRVLSLLLKTAASADPLSPRALAPGRSGAGHGMASASASTGRSQTDGMGTAAGKLQPPAVPPKSPMPVEIMDHRFSKPMNRLPTMTGR